MKDANTSIVLPTEFRYHRMGISIEFHMWSGNLETNMSVNGYRDLEMTMRPGSVGGSSYLLRFVDVNEQSGLVHSTFYLMKKTSHYRGEFLSHPVEAQLATPFFLGKSRPPTHSSSV